MIREQVERELRRPLEAVYAEFDPVPLASASLAQVHQARLHDGRRCAVKVQYPGIDGIVRADLRNMTTVLYWLAKLERDFDYRVLMREALKYVPMELDFIHEADNSATMRANFAADPAVIVPEVYREFTTRRVLTMELLEGIKVTDVDALERAGIDKHLVAQKLIEIFCDQVLRDGFFHADPHPGNILIQPGPKIVLLDFGLAKDFPPTFRDGIVRLTFSILSANRDGIIAAFQELGFRTRNGNPDTLLAFADLFLGSTVKSKKAYADKDLIEQFNEETTAGDSRESRGRSSRRCAAGRPHDGSAERARQIARLASRSVHDDHAVRAAPDDGAATSAASHSTERPGRHSGRQVGNNRSVNGAGVESAAVKAMRDWKPAAYKKYSWIVRDADLLGGKLAVRGTRLSVSFVLACLAEGMSTAEIAQTYGPFPSEAIPEIMKVTSDLLLRKRRAETRTTRFCSGARHSAKLVSRTIRRSRRHSCDQ